MRWIVGLDLLDLSQGAIRFAAWIHRQASAEVITGVHILTPQPLRFSPSDKTEEEFRAWVHGLAERAVDELGLLGDLEEVSVIEAETAEEGLLDALTRKGGSALIIGRKAKIGEDVFVRLGRVARRILRSLPAPVAVVPPDLAGDLPPGPVILATDLAPTSESALIFARELAEAVGRELVVVHAVALENNLRAYIAASAWDQAHLMATERGQAELQAWLDAHSLVGTRGLLVHAPVAHGILGICARERACMIVTGSRRMSKFERIFNSSVGGDLAALAAIPVVIVPPEGPGSPDPAA